MTLQKILEDPGIVYSISHSTKATEPGTHIVIVWGALTLHELVGKHARALKEFIAYKLEGGKKLVVYFNAVVALEYEEGEFDARLEPHEVEFCKCLLQNLKEHHAVDD